jgi:UDPglucose--hexose-1-phosphate uridylyltransferase
MIHTAPINLEREVLFHWHLVLVPRLSIPAGFEMGTGIYINITAPEEAAEHLRNIGSVADEHQQA